MPRPIWPIERIPIVVDISGQMADSCEIEEIGLWVVL